jgi:transposase
LQNNPTPWQPKSRENKELHEINVRINALKAELNRLTNSLEKKILNKAVQESIHRQSIKKDIKALEIEAKKIIEENDKLKQQFALLISIKGVGPKMTLTILADMPDVDGFETAKQFAAYVGVTPSHFQSGTSVNKKSHISRMGAKNIRKTMYMSSLVVKNHTFREFRSKTVEKRKTAEGYYRRYYEKIDAYFLRNAQK